MSIAEILGIIIATTTIIGVIFKVQQSWEKPQTATDKQVALLFQQLTDDRAGTDRRFKDVFEEIQKTNNLFHEHITREVGRYDILNNGQIQMGKDIVRLTTIIDERIPAKK